MNRQPFIINFIVSPRFRIGRHLMLILAFAIMAVNQGLMNYKEVLPGMGYRIYLIIFAIFLNYMFVGYLTLYTFIPKILASGKYSLFILCILSGAAMYTVVPNLISLLYLDHQHLYSRVFLLDNISSFLICILGMPGIIIPFFLKNWLTTHQRISQLEKNHVSSEVKLLKEQLNPSSFFNILNRTGALIKSEPQKASEMLMKLSRLLRYQLYDCNRNKVLLTSEISFIRNFLEMEHLYSPGFDFSIETTDHLNLIFIPPSLLLPYIQCVIKASAHAGKEKKLDVSIKNKHTGIYFILKVSGNYHISVLKEEMIRFEERLHLLFNEQYVLTITENKNTPLTFEVCLKLYNNHDDANEKR